MATAGTPFDDESLGEDQAPWLGLLGKAVSSGAQARNAAEKAAEKAAQGREQESLLAGVPRILPALVEAQQISSRAAGAGCSVVGAGPCWARTRPPMAPWMITATTKDTMSAAMTSP